jgi:hypothetical protein
VSKTKKVEVSKAPEKKTSNTSTNNAEKIKKIDEQIIVIQNDIEAKKKNPNPIFKKMIEKLENTKHELIKKKKDLEDD